MTEPEAASSTAAILNIGARAQQLSDSLSHAWENYCSGYAEYDIEALAAAAGALALVLDRLLADGHVDVLSVALARYDLLAAVAYRRSSAEQADYRADQQRREAEYQEATRRHELAVTVECPYCGAVPGLDCRTAGPTGSRYPKGIHDHAGRYRAATADSATWKQRDEPG
ncbi:MAG: hypothetical protein ACLP52_13060 [Streptosporangiaceae bacterium]